MNRHFNRIVETRMVVAETCQTMLDGTLSYIEGSRLICGLLESAKLERFEPPFVTFLAICSETDNVPVGKFRDQWHPEAKIRLAQEWENAEQYAKNKGESVCQSALAWLATHPLKVD
jgi:hypothetical protein